MKKVQYKKQIVPAIKEYIEKNGPCTTRELAEKIPHSKQIGFSPRTLGIKMGHSHKFKKIGRLCGEGVTDNPWIWDVK